MKIHRSVWRLAAVAAMAVSALGVNSAAQAREVFWSVGVGSPGVQFDVSNAPPVVYQRPIVVVPQPVYLPQPVVVYQPRQVYYGPPQVVYAPQPYYVQSGWAPPGFRSGWGKRDHRGNGRWNRDRWDRDRWDRDDDDDDDHRRGRGRGRGGRD